MNTCYHHTTSGLPALKLPLADEAAGGPLAQLKETAYAVADGSINQIELLGPSKPMSALRKQIQRLAVTAEAIVLTGAPNCGQSGVVEALLQASRFPKRQILTIDNENADKLLTHFANWNWRRDLLIYCTNLGTLSELAKVRLHRMLTSRRLADSSFVAFTEKSFVELVRTGRKTSVPTKGLESVQLMLPSLQERAEDIPMLFEYLITHYFRKQNRPVPIIHRELLSFAAGYAWPGHFKELHHVTHELAQSLVGKRILQSRDLQLCIDRSRWLFASSKLGFRAEKPRALSLQDVITQHVLAVESKCLGNRAQMAAQLGVSRSTVYRILSNADRSIQ